MTEQTYLLPTVRWGPADHYKIISEDSVRFRGREEAKTNGQMTINMKRVSF